MYKLKYKKYKHKYLNLKGGVNEKDIIIVSNRKAGFFSCLLGIIQLAYKHIKNNKVPYILWQNPKYMEDNDDNIFDYFFIQSNKPKNYDIVYEKGMNTDEILKIALENNLSFREQMNKMYNLICKLKPEFEEEINNFVLNNKLSELDSFHIRRTDRYKTKGGLIFAGPDDKMIIDYLKNNNLNEFYIATDSEDTYNKFKNDFNCISYCTIRSSNKEGLHDSDDVDLNNKKIAKEALIESILLSKSKKIHRMTSNFTTFSLIVNSKIPFIDLSILYRDEIKNKYELDNLFCEEFLSK